MQQDFNPEHQLLNHVAFDFKDLLQKNKRYILIKLNCKRWKLTALALEVKLQ